MSDHHIPIALIGIGIGIGLGFYAICDRDVLLFAAASILTVCAWHELLAEARSNQSTQRSNR